MHPDVRALPPIDAELLESRVLWSVTYYVSPTGDDGGPGTSPTTPFQTVARVNALDLAPGDRVLFKGSATFTGRLYLAPTDSGTAAQPITVGSFGGGRATLDGQGAGAIFAYNSAGFVIRDLNLVGGTKPNGAANDDSGINLYTDLPGNVLLDSVRIEKVDISGFGDYGIAAGGFDDLSGYSSLQITKSNLHDNGSAGLITYSQSPRANRGVVVSRVNAFRNGGGGIIIGGTDGAKVERSNAFDNTEATARAGIWSYDSNAVVIQRCKSSGNRAAGNGPGCGGFGLISDVTNSQLLSNQSSNNDGPGYLLADYVVDDASNAHLVKSNRSTNDGQKYGAGIMVEGAVRDTTIASNRLTLPASAVVSRGVYLSNESTPGMAVAGLLLERNTFSASTSSVTLVEVSPTQLGGATNLTFRANRYKPTSGVPYVQWGDAQYASVQAWRDATGQEPKR